MLKFPRLILLAIALLLWGCAQESPVGAEPEKEPEEEPEPPTPPEILVLRIDPSTDTIAFLFNSYQFVSAAVYRPDNLALLPQPEILWSISHLAGTEITSESLGSSLRLRSTGLGLARIVARSPALGLADTAVVRTWSPVASLLFEIERDTVVERGHIDWRIEARNAEGEFVQRSLVTVTASPSSLAQVDLRGGTGLRLGPGTITATALPFSISRSIMVVPLLIDQLQRGDGHSCVRRDDLRIMCSGQNAYLQLGRETPWLVCTGSAQQYCVTGSAGWVEVPWLDEVIAFDVARLYACAIRVGGELLCWGASDDWQLGTTVDNEYCGSPNAGYWFITCLPGPRPVASELRFRAISAGGSTVCALTVDDKAWCWGTTAHGARLGNGSTEGSRTPVPESSGHSFRSIDAGEHTTCAVDFSDVAWCWGQGAQGELGAGAEVATAVVPTRVVGDISFLTVQNGVWGTCGLSTAGQAFCWGGANAYQGGIPLAAAGERRFTEIAVGGEVCAATASGEVWCWNADAPQQVSGIPPLTRITMTPNSGCGISANQTSHCWLNGTRAATATTPR